VRWRHRRPRASPPDRWSRSFQAPGAGVTRRSGCRRFRDFRAALVRTNDEIEGVTLYGGEEDEQGRLDRLFQAVVTTTQRIVLAVTGLTWVTAGAGWLAIVAPIILAAPAYFQGPMTFGQLMMLIGAFNQVQSALQWFVNNFSNIADWLATLIVASIVMYSLS
jgi:vitamin B12/bleomycin/antimicrobial peptide transport system ATP-binding/permease protein